MKKLSLLLVALLALTAAEARPIGEQEARQKASQFFGNLGQKRMAKGKVLALRKTPELAVAVSRNEFYVFNDEANGGFVIVSGEDRMPGVLGYSYDSHFDADNIPCNLQAWLEGYADQARYLREHPEAQSAPRQAPVNDHISPLLDCHWGQGEPYNRKCPIIDGQHAMTGCVATAMAQVMYYYKWPEVTTQPIPGYTTQDNKITVPEQPVTRIDWQNMLPDYQYGQYSDEQADAVAQLMLLCGASLATGYGLLESGAEISEKSINVFELFFDYYGGEIIYRHSFDFQVWCQLLYEELKESRPVLYCGYRNMKGHQFVLDGYDVVNDGEDAEAYFHVNFGWGGSTDAYLALNNVDGFNGRQYAVVGLRPNSPGTNIPYATLDKGKMTFYYDTKKTERPGKVFFWRSLEDKQEISECEFDTSFADYRIANCTDLFDGCANLRFIKGLKNLNSKYVSDMSNMFYDCSKLTNLDMSGVNTENVKYMNRMFEGCSSLKSLDLSGFNTSNVTDMYGLFSGCSSLTTIYASERWNTQKVTSGYYMFDECRNLVGGKGTAYDWNHTDHGYARIDGGSTSPGYFTQKVGTGIKNLLTNKDKEKSIYSLDGQRLSSPQKGVNIIGGKKVVVR